MKLNKKISEREIKLMLIFLILLIMVSAYLFGFKEYSNKTRKLKAENAGLIIQKNELLQKEANKDRTLALTKELNNKADKLLNEFPATLSQERITMIINYLMKASEINISTISFGDTSVFYQEEMAEADATDGATTNSGSGNSASANSESLNSTTTNSDAVNTNITDATIAGRNSSATLGLQESETGTPATGVIGYKTSITINYQATYDALKESIAFFNNNSDRMNITDLTAAFDNKTGNLTGMMKLDMYAINSSNREKSDPFIDGTIGSKNIFGTFE